MSKCSLRHLETNTELQAFNETQSMTVSYQVAHCYHACRQDRHAAITHPIATSTMKLVNFSPESRIQAQRGTHQLHDARRLVPGGQREKLLYIAQYQGSIGSTASTSGNAGRR
jgi:hypothetical protein